MFACQAPLLNVVFGNFVGTVQEFEMESSVHAFGFQRHGAKIEFPFALGRHAQNAVLIVPPRG